MSYLIHHLVPKADKNNILNLTQYGVDQYNIKHKIAHQLGKYSNMIIPEVFFFNSNQGHAKVVVFILCLSNI